MSMFARTLSRSARTVALAGLVAAVAAGGWLALEAALSLRHGPSTSEAGSPGSALTPIENPSFGYQVSLPVGWRRSSLLSYEKPQAPSFLGREVFTMRSLDEETKLVNSGQTVLNPALDFVVEVEVYRNPDGLTARQWATSDRHAPQSARQTVAETVVDRVPAIAVTDNGYHSRAHYIARGGVVFVVAYRDVDSALRPVGADPAALQILFRSFRFTR